jgi:hypothetical protein
MQRVPPAGNNSWQRTTVSSSGTLNLTATNLINPA